MAVDCCFCWEQCQESETLERGLHAPRKTVAYVMQQRNSLPELQKSAAVITLNVKAVVVTAYNDMN